MMKWAFCFQIINNSSKFHKVKTSLIFLRTLEKKSLTFSKFLWKIVWFPWVVFLPVRCLLVLFSHTKLWTSEKLFTHTGPQTCVIFWRPSPACPFTVHTKIGHNALFIHIRCSCFDVFVCSSTWQVRFILCRHRWHFVSTNSCIYGNVKHTLL